MLDRKKKQKLKKLHKDLCNQLGIFPTTISWERVWKLNGDESVGSYTHKNNHIKINPLLSFKRARWVMAHETYHHYQNTKGLLSGVRYKSRLKSFWRKRTSWSKWPWERAAIRFADLRTGKRVN